MAATEHIRLKLVLIGTFGAGKTSILWRFIKDEFRDPRPATVICSPPYQWMSIDGVEVKVEMWDTGGGERYGGGPCMYYREMDCGVCVYDLGSERWRQDLEYWYGEMVRCVGGVDWELPPFIVLGAKADQVSASNWSQVQTWSRSKAAPYFISSAKTGTGVSEAIQEAARLGLQYHLLRHSSPNTSYT